MPVHFINCEIC